MLFALWLMAAPSSMPAEEDSVFAIFEEEEKAESTDASGRVVALREAPGSHWVIDQTTLQLQPGLDLYDMLRTLPGMIPREVSLHQAEANMRVDTGTPDLETLVVVDGRSVSSDGAGAFYDRSLLNLRDIDHVEVVNGPQSTLYGPNALFGVISVTRKKPKLDARDDLTIALDGGIASGSPTTVPQLSAGPLGRAYLSYDHGWGTGGLRLSAAADYLPDFGDQADSGVVVKVPGERITGSVDVLQNVGAWQLRAQADAAGKSSVYEIIDSGKTTQQDYSLNLLAERQNLAGEGDRLLINAWVRRYEIDMAPEAFDRPLAWFNTQVTSFEARSVYALPIFYNNAITVGAQTRLSLNAANYQLLYPADQMLVGLFAEDTWRPIRQLVVTAGLRLDDTVTFGEAPFRDFHASPRLALAYLINDHHSLRAEYASAFRNPVIIEQAANIVAPNGAPILLGNPNLKDESIDGFLLGYMGEIRWFTMRLEAYLSHAKNIISPSLEPFGSTNFTGPDGQPEYQPIGGGRWKYPFYFYNINELWIPGALARLEAKPIDKLRLFANYTWQPIEVQHFAGVGGDYRIGRWQLAAQIFYNDQPLPDPTRDHDLPGRVIFNARIAYTFDEAKRFTLAATVMNAANVRFFWYRTPGRPADYGDQITGEQLGPRGWITLEIHPFGSK